MRWDQALLSASETPTEMVLEGLYNSKLQDSVQLQTVFASYDQDVSNRIRVMRSRRPCGSKEGVLVSKTGFSSNVGTRFSPRLICVIIEGNSGRGAPAPPYSSLARAGRRRKAKRRSRRSTATRSHQVRSAIAARPLGSGTQRSTL